jgi:bifunctional oligoribonuclease and PAP phosphatase NrnA
MAMTQTMSDLTGVVSALRDPRRLLLTSHENPDGDALGSLLALHLALERLGKDSTMVLGGAAPLPGEYRFLELAEHGVVRTRPEVDEYVLIAVDCANASRIAIPELLADASLSVNIDHHHDNTRFADVNLVDPSSSSTGELLADVLAAADVTISPEIAEALYVALVTDTGRFQYSNTTPRALRLAATLVEAGADSHKVFRAVYESVQYPKLKLLARALERARLVADGRAVVSYLLRADFGEVGAVEPYSEGIIDHLRAVEGTELAALIREPPRDGPPARKVSLRASVDTLDVSAIARSFGGGGHRQAAGFSTELSIEAIIAGIAEQLA